MQAAARNYFDKDVAELDLGQQALIAGLAQAPSRYSPFVDEDAAYKRRGEVLDNMVENGALSRAEARPVEEGAAARARSGATTSTRSRPTSPSRCGAI